MELWVSSNISRHDLTEEFGFVLPNAPPLGFQQGTIPIGSFGTKGLP
jgi:hypothetical protein